MNFPKVYKSEEMLDIIVNTIKKNKDLLKKENAVKYISTYQLLITEKYTKILNELPDNEKMNDYYRFMSKNIVPESTLERYKNHYRSTIHIINKLCEKYKKVVFRYTDKKSKLAKQIIIKKEFFGRIASVIKKLDKTNEELLNLAKEYKRIAKPNFNLYTICLVGIPNAGKTTVLTKITDANPEINSYAFTTKALNIGYFSKREKMVQVIDTPGLIHLEFKDMNKIEKQAIVAVKTLADLVVFIYNNNLDLKEQEDMLNSLKENNPNKEFVVLASFSGKMDLEKNITISDLLNIEPK
ncbi:MAG: 50S ribosome-binding GTPase [Candidatus ainarchaeum sp.]|nr:50S ribosome-binding GTPase [Candidatus ainarchaeum sp.]